MQAIPLVLGLVLAYLLGATPFGLLIVRVATGQDVRRVHSGRTGGTNVARAAGVWAGLLTGLLDGLKGALAVWIVRGLAGGAYWFEAAAAALAVLGHNYSVFLLEKSGSRLRLRGGAGGATTVGAAIAMWTPSVLVIPLGVATLLLIGYASVATMSVGLFTTTAFLWRAIAGLGPWEYAAFGVAATGLLIYALRPNIRRLVQGSERLVGLRAYLRNRRGRGRSAPPDGSG
ncbi:MAG: hypothetical protein A2Y93_04630 [Chloroflexi bacterium RBG_13_68_17]|jgi:glycerol-3-phosphate acyltransferase PlsY|nr:MAG: hypothetical protein A2Y93_04630 [Chloroflexi bacterium RBG_13_68_17]